MSVRDGEKVRKSGHRAEDVPRLMVCWLDVRTLCIRLGEAEG